MSSPLASVLVEPFDSYLARRARSTVPLTPGEAVTITVALLRGCRGASGRSTGLRWWLRADGCPVLVDADEDEIEDAVATTADLLAHTAAITDHDETRDMVTRAREGVLTRPPREWESVERRLFQHADPEPLVLGPLTPADREPPLMYDDPPRERSPRVLALVDADLAAAVGEVLRDLRARWRTSRLIRLGTVAAAAALVVVAIAVVWPQPRATSAIGATSPPPVIVADPHPTAGPEERSAGTERNAEAPGLPGGSAPAADAGSAPGPVPEEPDDPVAATAPAAEETIAASPDDAIGTARAVFAEIDRCAGDTDCVGAFSDGSTDALAPNAPDADIDVIDDFGGVVVVRLTTDETSQYVTLVRQEDRWLVRAVKTIADQPS